MVDLVHLEFVLIDSEIALLAILQKSLDQAIFLYMFIRKIRESFDRNCAHSKILQNLMKYCSINIPLQNS